MKDWFGRSPRAKATKEYLEDHQVTTEGLVRGKPFSVWPDTIKQLRRDGQVWEAEQLLLECVEATEAAAKVAGYGVAPWYYEQLAILYRKEGEGEKELQILRRFARQTHAPGATPSKLVERLAKLEAKA